MVGRDLLRVRRLRAPLHDGRRQLRQYSYSAPDDRRAAANLQRNQRYGL